MCHALELPEADDEQMNLYGAKDRPSLVQIKENIFAQIDGKKKPHKMIKTQTFWQGIRYKAFG